MAAKSLEERLYARAPLWAQNLLISAKGAEFRWRRASTAEMDRELERLLRSQWLSAEALRAAQEERLRALLSVAFTQVPYYRALAEELHLRAEDFRTVADLKRLPLLEKSRLRGHEQEFLNQSVDLAKCSKNFTSGTTGTPINLYESRETFSARTAFIARLRVWAGLRDPHYPKRVQFTGRSIVPNTQQGGAYWRHNLPGRSLLMSTVHISPETAAEYARAMRDFEPELIDGYPSAILVVARLAERLRLELPQPKAIIVSAETLTDEDRQALESAFRCRVYNQYGASEPSCLWGDCGAVDGDHHVMHESPEYGISELLRPDGSDAGPDEEGEVVVTSVLNTVMPLIRYRLGDTARRGPDRPCPCGRALPRMRGVLGRTDDILYVPERGYVGRLDPSFKGLSNIVEAQIRQESLDRIRVLLVPAPGYSPEMADKLVSNLRNKLGTQVRIEVEVVASIERGARGKLRAVVSEVRHLYPDQVGADWG